MNNPTADITASLMSVADSVADKLGNQNLAPELKSLAERLNSIKAAVNTIEKTVDGTVNKNFAHLSNDIANLKKSNTQSQESNTNVLSSVLRTSRQIDTKVGSFSKEQEKQTKLLGKFVQEVNKQKKQISSGKETTKQTVDPENTTAGRQTMLAPQAGPSVTPVSVNGFGDQALESLETSLSKVLPIAIKEGLKDLNKTLKDLASSGGLGGGGSSIIDTVLTGLGLKSILPGGKPTTTKPTKPGFFRNILNKAKGILPGASASATSRRPTIKPRAGFGLPSMLGGAAVAGLASWGVGKALGKDEDVVRIDPKQIEQEAKQAQLEGDKKGSAAIQYQTKAQKKEVGIEMAQTGASALGYAAGNIAAKKLVASAAGTRVWRVFMVYIKRKAPSLFAKIGIKLAAAAGLASIPVVGWIGAIVNLGFALWTAYDLYTLWNEFSALSDIERAYYAQEDEKTPDSELPKVEDKQAEDLKKRHQESRRKGRQRNNIKPSTSESEPTIKPSADTEIDTKPINVDEGILAFASSPEYEKSSAAIQEVLQERRQKNENKKQELEEKIKKIQSSIEEEKLQLIPFEEAMGSKESLDKHKIRSERILKYTSELDLLKKQLEETNKWLTKPNNTQTPAIEESKTSEPTKKIEPRKKSRTRDEPKKKLAEGGIVPATPGGRDVTVAEAGQAEAVIPLNKLSEVTNKSDKTLEQVAKNTQQTNEKLDRVSNGFEKLAKALEQLGVSIVERPPTVINNVSGGGGQDNRQQASAAQLASKGNPDISLFRSRVVEASRFVPA